MNDDYRRDWLRKRTLPAQANLIAGPGSHGNIYVLMFVLTAQSSARLCNAWQKSIASERMVQMIDQEWAMF